MAMYNAGVPCAVAPFNKSMMLALLNLYLKAMPLILERNRVTHKG